MAGVVLHRLIIAATPAPGRDQGHRDVVHLSFASEIDDRTEYLTGTGTVYGNPGMQMADIMTAGILAARRVGRRRFVIGIPCNTFHAPHIFDPFTVSLQEQSRSLAIPAEDVVVVHMLHETVDLLKRSFPGVTRVGLLATTGTRLTGVWHDMLVSHGLTPVDIPIQQQPILHDCIYAQADGLKALSRASERVLGILGEMAVKPVQDGAEVIILGCTQLPIAFEVMPVGVVTVPTIDPMEALAAALVRESSDI